MIVFAIRGSQALTIKSAAAIAAALSIAACTQQAPKADTDGIKLQIQQQEARWNEAYNKHDAAGLAAMYADDGALANAGSDLVRGKEALQKATAQFASDPHLKVAFEANRIQVAQSGDLAYSRGHYTLTMTNPATKKPEMTTGYYLTVWQKQSDGSWKAVEDFTAPGAPQVAQRATALP
jgi:uncharacterized protein (TIGR02246 family)